MIYEHRVDCFSLFCDSRATRTYFCCSDNQVKYTKMISSTLGVCVYDLLYYRHFISTVSTK